MGAIVFRGAMIFMGAMSGIRLRRKRSAAMVFRTTQHVPSNRHSPAIDGLARIGRTNSAPVDGGNRHGDRILSLLIRTAGACARFFPAGVHEGDATSKRTAASERTANVPVTRTGLPPRTPRQEVRHGFRPYLTYAKLAATARGQ